MEVHSGSYFFLKWPKKGKIDREGEIKFFVDVKDVNIKGTCKVDKKPM